MPRIRCHYIDCVYLEDGYCGSVNVEIDPDEGCLTYTHIADAPLDEAWEEEELEEIWDEEDDELYDLDEEEDDLWEPDDD
jgi:hypothetical protein